LGALYLRQQQKHPSTASEPRIDDGTINAACETTTITRTAAAPAGTSSFFNSSSSNYKLLVQYGDYIYLKGEWDAAPIVVIEYKLVFFTVPKVGCTAFKQLFRRMMGYQDWDVEEYDQMLPWNPSANGLSYLYDYDPEQATLMMTSPEWTRAIFVREPKTRLLSAYLDKAVGVGDGTYLREKCCPYHGECVEPGRESLRGFLECIVYFCDNAHWRPQNRRLDAKYWPYVNFVGHLETLRDDARRMLERIGAWKEFGASGWGPNGNGSIFDESTNSFASNNNGQKHATSAAAKLRRYYDLSDDPELAGAVELFYAEDYSNPFLNITRIVLG
jgi:hypothetical protein